MDEIVGVSLVSFGADVSEDDLLVRLSVGNPRRIPRQHTSGIKVHRSVKMRMEAETGNRYHPKAAFTVDPTWVD